MAKVRKLLLTATVFLSALPISMAAAGHWEVNPRFVYPLAGWNLRYSYVSDTQESCDIHWTHSEGVSVYAYGSFPQSYLEWVRLYNGVTAPPSGWMFGQTYIWDADSTSQVDSFTQPFWADYTYYVNEWFNYNSNGITIRTQMSFSPGDECTATGYFILIGPA